MPINFNFVFTASRSLINYIIHIMYYLSASSVQIQRYSLNRRQGQTHRHKMGRRHDYTMQTQTQTQRSQAQVQIQNVDTFLRKPVD